MTRRSRHDARPLWPAIRPAASLEVTGFDSTGLSTGLAIQDLAIALAAMESTDLLEPPTVDL